MSKFESEITEPYDADFIRERRGRPFFPIAETTEPSPKHPERNEDAFFIDAKNGLLALSDGAGGHANGAEMSREVMRLAAEQTARMSDQTFDKTKQAMDAAVLEIAEKSERFSIEITPAGQGRAMATLLMGKLIEVDGGYAAIVKSVGDSPVYLCRADGRIERVALPEDDILTLLVLQREISQEEAFLFSEATSEEQLKTALIARDKMIESLIGKPLRELTGIIADLKKIKKRNAAQNRLLRLAKLAKLFKNYFSRKRGAVTQAIGLPKEKLSDGRLEIHTDTIYGLKKGDRLIFASDGITSLTQKEIIEVLGQEKDFQKQLEGLRQAASARSADSHHLRAKPDDITIIGLEVPEVLTRPAVGPSRSPRKKRGETSRITQISEALARALRLAK